MMDARSHILSQGRWRWYEPLLWLAVFALPALLPGHALIVNEIAIVALFAVSLDLVLGYTGIVTLARALSDTIDCATSQTVNQYEAVVLIDQASGEWGIC